MSARSSRHTGKDRTQLRILFEASWWREGPPSLKRVLRESIQTWQRCYPNDRLAVLVKPDARKLAEEELGPAVIVRTTRWRPQALAAMVGTILPSLRLRPDVVFTHNFTSLTPFSRRVVLIHDVMFCEHPEWFTRAENLYFSLMPRTAPFAHSILGTSATEAGRISRYLRGRTVTPVGLGMSQELIGAAPVDALPEVLSDLVPGRFLLSVGRLNARKNLMATIQGALAADLLSKEFPLLVVGSRDGLQDTAPIDVQDAVNAGFVRYTGYVDDSVLVWLYKHCQFFTFLSLDEGYGLPPLEALQFGAPVLVSDIAIFRELLADLDHVVFCDPRDVEAVSSAALGLAKLDRAEWPDGVPTVSERHSWDAVVEKMRSAIAGKL